MNTQQQAQPAPMVQELDNNEFSAKGFSLTFPGQDEWTVVTKDPYKVVMTKPGNNDYERYTIQALVVNLPGFKNDQEFMNFIKSRMKKNHNRSGTKMINQNVRLVEGQEKMCVQYNSQEKKTGKSKTVMLDMVSYTCHHPDREKAGVYMAYSKRYNSDSLIEDLTVKATELFSRLNFIEL